MIDAQILDAMVAAGASAEVIAAAVKADNDKAIARVLTRRMRDAERKREQRARDKESAMSRGHDVTLTDSSGQPVTARDALSPNKETSPTPPKEIKPLSEENPSLRDGQKKGTRLPNDWVPSEENLDDAMRLGISRAGIPAEGDRFRDYWISKPGANGCKLDWNATWRNWCRNVRGPPNGVRQQQPSNVENSVNVLERLRTGPNPSDPAADFSAGSALALSDFRRTG